MYDDDYPEYPEDDMNDFEDFRDDEDPDTDECDDPEMDDLDDEEAFVRQRFADPGGKSALHAASASNPRNLPCPTCRRENVLTAKDVAKGYQCDACADEAEGGGY